MSTAPTHDLHLRALEERAQLHRSVCEVRNKLLDIRGKLRFAKQAREHFTAFSISAAFVGLVSGYACAGLFTRH
jgi:hypothetical protein